MLSRAKVLFATMLLVLWMVAGWTTSSQADVMQVVIQTDQMAIDNDVTHSVYQQSFNLSGTMDITGVTVTKPGGGTFSLTNNGGGSWNFNSDAYVGLTDLQADYPQGSSSSYGFAIDYASKPRDSVSLSFAPVQPTGFVAPSSPTSGATNVPYNPAPTFHWDRVAAENGLALGCELRYVGGGQSVDGVHPYDIGQTSWTPAISRLDPSTQYEFSLSIYQIGATSTDQITQNGDPFTYYGVFGHTDVIQFSTVPEPGTLILLAAGFMPLLLWWRRR